MASVCPLCFITKMEIQTIWHPSLTKMEMQTNGRPSFFMFDHKDGNSIWRPSVCYV